MLTYLTNLAWRDLSASAFVLICLLAVFDPSAPQNERRENHVERAAKQNPHEIAWLDSGGWTAVFTALLTCSTIGLWIANRGLLEANKQALTDTKKSADAMASVAESMAQNVTRLKDVIDGNKKIVRAYLSVVIGEFYAQDKDKNAPLQIHPHVLNTGNSPARDVVYSGRVVIRDFPPGPNFDFTVDPPDPESSSITIGSRQVPTPTIPLQARQWFTDEELDEARRAQTKRIYCFGTVNYQDAFGEPHFTNFCYSTIWSVQGQPQGIWTRLHNDSD